MPATISEAFASPLNKSKSEQGGYNDVLSKYFPSNDNTLEEPQPQPQPQPQQKIEKLTENIRTEINNTQNPYTHVGHKSTTEHPKSEQKDVHHRSIHKEVKHGRAGVEHDHMDYSIHHNMRPSVHEDCHDQISSILACHYCRSKLRTLLSDEQPSLQNQTGGNPLSTIMSSSNSEMVNLFLIVGMVMIIHKLFLSK